MERSLAYATAIVAAHLIALVLHGAAHVVLNITPPAEQLAFVVLVIYIAPVAALVLLRRSVAVGAGLLMGSMAASFSFGVVLHLILPGTDNLAQVPAGPWGSIFQATGIVIATLEALGVVVGGWTWMRARTGSTKAAAQV